MRYRISRLGKGFLRAKAPQRRRKLNIRRLEARRRELDLRDTLEKFRESLAGAPGPAYLEIGRDILDAKVDLTKAVLPKAGFYRASTKSDARMRSR